MQTPERLFAAIYDRLIAPEERAGLADLRAGLLSGLHGTVVEVGAGTGLNLRHYPAAVDRLVLVEPAAAMADRLRRRVAQERPTARVVRGVAEALPVRTGSADAVVVTLVLCSVPDPGRAAAEIRRVLRPGGVLAVLEHVAGAGWLLWIQRALQPPWRVLGRGCHLARDTRSVLQAAGFDTATVADTELPGISLTRPGIVGPAHPP